MTVENKDLSLLDALRKVLEERREYAVGLVEQLQERVANGIITKLTAQHHVTALDNLDAADLALDKREYYNALYFLSRACVNLGELIGRADKEKKAS